MDGFSLPGIGDSNRHQSPTNWSKSHGHGLRSGQSVHAQPAAHRNSAALNQRFRTKSVRPLRLWFPMPYKKFHTHLVLHNSLQPIIGLGFWWNICCTAGELARTRGNKQRRLNNIYLIYVIWIPLQIFGGWCLFFFGHWKVYQDSPTDRYDSVIKQNPI